MKGLKKLRAKTTLHCLDKCLSATINNLRGINYVASVASCSCVPKITDVWYNVTNSANLPGCVSFCAHGKFSIKKSFDYVVESHKCFSLQTSLNTWYNSRTLCNNLLSSHPVVIESSTEIRAVQLYALSVEKDFVPCILPGNVNTFFIWTASSVTYNYSVARPSFGLHTQQQLFACFFFLTVMLLRQSQNCLQIQLQHDVHAAQYKKMVYYRWLSGEPNSPANCVCFTLDVSYFGWDDNRCSKTLCTENYLFIINFQEEAYLLIYNTFLWVQARRQKFRAPRLDCDGPPDDRGR
ncbi:hypothetical protein HELRODRAFT_178471 [Helobdella robusta]|uniref:C-type lectin domain-containing protein n=1 Tax=Helobdella robusta TaxID=6412 RepID=T1FD79_HELRO|nr:hypothetical protein HELRODRAFT_178471 [Helobdella robusta]ESN97028.1 hypothetical protein HELRODRAFT_178471 [Helobdella robusta]